MPTVTKKFIIIANGLKWEQGGKFSMDNIFTILEVANMLEITTQAVYKRLQQDKEDLDQHVTVKGGKKSLTQEGVEKLSDLMGIKNPFQKEEETDTEAVTNDTPTVDNTISELLNYLRDDNQRLLKELESIKEELNESRALREADRRTAEEERRTHEEARLRADALLMKAMINQEQPKLLDRIFRRRKKNNNEMNDNDLFS